MRHTTALGAVLLLGTALASCGGRTATGSQADSLSVADSGQTAWSVMKLRTVSYEDSLQTDSGAYLSQAIKTVWPMPSDRSVLADSVRAWLAQTVAHSCYPSYEEGDDVARFSGDVRDGQALVNFYAKQGMERMKAEVKESETEGYVMPGMNNGLKVECLCQNERYTTMLTSYDVYLGGAHGGYMLSGATFRNADGHVMGWDLVDMSKKAQLIDLIYNGLKPYFEVGPDDKIEDMLQLMDDESTPEDESKQLPLPATPPFFTADGVEFIYQQYEIAPYAAGLPLVVIPYEQIRELLSADGKALLADD